MKCSCGRNVTPGTSRCWRCFADSRMEDLVNLDYADKILESFRANERDLVRT